MPNQLRARTKETRVSASTIVGAYNNAIPPTLVFPCKDISGLFRIMVNVTVGYCAVVTALVRNVATVMVFKTQISYAGAAANAVTCRAGGAGLERAVAGAGNDTGGSTVAVEIPNGVAITITGTAIGAW